MPNLVVRVLSSLLIAVFASGGFADDWPMWRYSVERQASSPSELPVELSLQWSRQLPVCRPAWPNESRLHFDASYEPIVVDNRLIVSSPNDGSVTAFDTRSGDQLWKTFADAPVRLAPVASEHRIYFGSDDGYLYCVRAEDGALLWRVRGAPSERQECWHLGNGRLVSFWPVRGGPVVDDGVVYFAAGIWPSLGIFVHAVDAVTGQRVWTNSTSHYIADLRIDHNYVHEGGISPQGHMLLRGDMLVVPNGRSMPARFHRHSGERMYYVQGYRNGDCRVTLGGGVALVGKTGVFNLQDGREIGSRWAEAGEEAPAGWSGKKKDLFEGPFYPYKFLPGCDHRSAIHDGIAYGVEAGIVYAYDLNQAARELYDKEEQGIKLQPLRWDPKRLWQLDLSKSADVPPAAREASRASTHVMIRAGKHLVTHVGNWLVALELAADANQAPCVVWMERLEYPASSLLVGDARLFVVSENGSIHAFGIAQSQTNRNEPTAPTVAESDATDGEVAEILALSSTREGYAVVAGLRDGKIVDGLLRQTDFHVIAIGDNAEVVAGLRANYAAGHPYARRFQAIRRDSNDLRLPAYLASLLVSETPEKVGRNDAVGIQRLLRLLRPYGGVACFPNAEATVSAWKSSISPEQIDVTLEEQQGWICLRRSGPLVGTVDWTHETADAARSFYSADDLVRPPLAVLWYGDGPEHGFYKRKDYGHGVKPQVAGGRMVALQIATNTLHAVDAYTGRLLWKRRLERSARYATFPDCVYVAAGRTCQVLDAASGEVQADFAIPLDRPQGQPVSVTDIRVAEDVILLGLRYNATDAISEGRWDSDILVALDRERGHRLWDRPAEHRYHSAAVALDNGRAYCIDSHSPREIALLRRRGENADALPSRIIALDARTGAEVWAVVKHDAPADLSSLHFMSMRTHDDWLSVATGQGLLLVGKAARTYALNVTSGADVWAKSMTGQQPLIVGPDRFINQAGQTYEIASGDLLDGRQLFKRTGCNYAVGGKNLVFLRDSCAAYVDVESGDQYNLRNLRSGCSNSLVAADGVLNVPCFSVGCICNYPLQTSFAMVHEPAAEDWHRGPTSQPAKAAP